MRHTFNGPVIGVLLGILASLPLSAIGSEPLPAIDSEPLPDTGDTKADVVQENISARVADAAGWLDSFFGNDNYEYESNKTRLTLGLSSFSEKGEGTDLKLDTSLRLNLPYLEDRLRLTLSGASQDFDTTDSDWEDIEEDILGTDERNLRAALTYFFRQGDRRNLSLSAGVRSRDGKAAFYLQPRYRHTWYRGDWDLRFVQKVSWYTDTSWDARGELQLERLLGHDWLFRTTGRVNWYEEEDGVFPQLNFGWHRRLSERRALSITWQNYFETYPNSVLDSSTLRLRYRQQVWRRWFWLSVSPQLVFPREQDYDTVPGIMIEVEARFQERS